MPDSIFVMRMTYRRMTYRRGYTLVELIIAVGILIMLLAAAISSVISSRESFIFNNAVTQISLLVRQARSLAVTAKAQPDYTDFDKDGLDYKSVPPDLATPANYGIFFGNKKITLFVDVHRGDNRYQTEAGRYEAPSDSVGFGDWTQGYDVKLAEFEINNELKLIIDPNNTDTFLFSPVFADITFYKQLKPTDEFFIFGIKEKHGNKRKQCFKIHPVAGVPEVADVEECPS